MTKTPTIQLNFRPNGKPGRGTVVLEVPGGAPFTNEINLFNADAREEYVLRACDGRPGIDRNEVQSQLDRWAAEETKRQKVNAGDAAETLEQILAGKDARSAEELARMSERARRRAESLLMDPCLIQRVQEDVEAMGAVGERIFSLTTYLIGTSRLLRGPLSAIVQGGSSSGKSYVPMCVAKLFPPESILLATDITPNALYYLPPGTLTHCFVVAGERRRSEDDEHAEVTRALREMLSGGSLRKVVTAKGKDGRMAAQVIDQAGPIAYIESTTRATIFNEDANRSLLLATDETEQQSRRIAEAQARRAQGESTDCDPIIETHTALQRMLQRVVVHIPFADILARDLPTEHVESRRAFPKVLAMIQAVAVLHQRQRLKGSIRHGDVIYATVADYGIAREILLEPMARAVGGGLPRAVERLGRVLLAEFGAEQFTTTDASVRAILSKSKVNEYMKVLESASLATFVGGGKGTAPSVWRMRGQVPVSSALWLPTPEDLSRIAK